MTLDRTEARKASRVLFDGLLGFLLVFFFVQAFLPARPLNLPTGASSAGIVLLSIFGFSCGAALGARPYLVGDGRRIITDALFIVGTLLVASLVVLPALNFDLSVTALGLGILGAVLTYAPLLLASDDRGRFLRRATASVFDGVPALALWYVSVWTVPPAVGLRTPPGATWSEVVAVVAVLFVWSITVRLPFEAYDGRSLGKRLAGVRVVGEDGDAPSLRAVLVRNALRPLDSLPFGYVVGTSYAARSEDGRRIGDAVAGTRVVRDGEA